MKCCILGGGGFIGTNIAQRLVADGVHVRIFGRPSPYADAVSGAVHYQGEFADIPALQAAVDGCDLVYHLIGSTNPVTAENDKLFDLRDNVENSLHLLDMGARGAFGRLVFLSSGGTIYGIQQNMPIAEDAPQWPISSYGVTKLALERYLNLYGHLQGLDYRIARLSNPFGEFQVTRKGQGVIATILRCALTGDTFRIVGDGSVTRDYIYIGDAVDALVMLGHYRGGERVFNVASGRGHSIMDLVGLVESLSNRPITRQHLPSRAIDVPVNILDITRIQRELGWTPQTPMAEALNRAYRWMGEIIARPAFMPV
ncbi:NAD-dependent epimerase/dehydratase family protein [Niveispirillum sp. SYP-B3756]|uniref:NAD-dependent epimerase/dehydratase family protein n=1 Tax=Niveispirillum sp. SYP-B3756 TaxID=2662178 RepID=UPI001292424B|nr:NAD-dependent epimerase/dehydratase family protein [Niveispirillum sp. SYP-B3756]MQP68115.1 NAD-dependent epimerase/dehydratase family protein [Niveispirillum sp. SYP-B3756]